MTTHIDAFMIPFGEFIGSVTCFFAIAGFLFSIVVVSGFVLCYMLKIRSFDSTKLPFAVALGGTVFMSIMFYSCWLMGSSA